MKEEEIDKNHWTDFMDRLSAASKSGLTVTQFKRKIAEKDVNQILGTKDATKVRK